MNRDSEKIALAFAKECLGWENAVIAGHVSGNPPMINEGTGKYGGQFRYANLNTVLSTIHDFSENGSISLQSQALTPKWYAEVWMKTARDINSFRKGQARQNDPCLALMAACLDAARKIREAKKYV